MLGALLALAGDPSSTWEAFAVAPSAGRVEWLNCSYVVPERPVVDDGTTPKWWCG